MAIELAITDHRPLLEELKAATRARIGNAGESTIEVSSEPYEAWGMTIRYIVKNRSHLPQGRRRHEAWKGCWYIGWRRIGENQLMGILRDCENDKPMPS